MATIPIQPVAPKRPWRAIFLGVALSIALPVLAFQGVNLTQTWNLVAQCQGGLLALGGGFFLLALGIRAWRWQQLLRAQHDVGLRSCASATCVGFFANNILPLRLGDLVRVGVLKQFENVSGASVLGSVVVEKVLDIFTLTFFLGVYLVFAAAGEHRGELLWAGRTALLGAVAIAAVLLVGYWRRTWLPRLFAKPASWISPKLGEKGEGLVSKFLGGLQVFGSTAQVFAVMALSCALWGSEVASYYYVGQSIGLTVAPSDYVVVVFATAFGAILPAAPGAVGTFHGFARLGLYLVAVHSSEKALAFAALLHAVEWMLMNVTGLYFLVCDRLTLRNSDQEQRSSHATSSIPADPGSKQTEYAQSV